MAKSRRELVRERAHGCCEYCQLPDAVTVTPHEIDHIRAHKHQGRTVAANLALACFYCNAFKGPKIAGYDPVTNTLQPLFDPRRDDWDNHFEWRGAALAGKTAIGRTTIEVLCINLPERVEHRQRLMDAGLFPHG